MSHTRAKKMRKPFDVEAFTHKWKTHVLNTKIGVYEVDEYRDFYVVKKRLRNPSQKGFYDPTAFVVAKRDKKVPIFPDRDFAGVFGDASAFFFYHTGVEGKDHFQEQLKNIRKGNTPLGIPLYFKQALHIEPTPQPKERK